MVKFLSKDITMECNKVDNLKVIFNYCSVDSRQSRFAHFTNVYGQQWAR